MSIPTVLWPKNACLWPFWHFFQSNVWGKYCSYQWCETRWKRLILQSGRRTEITRGGFANVCLRVETWVHLCRLWRKIRKKRSAFRGRIWKLGGKILPLPKLGPVLLPILDSEFNVEYDFSIRHDPTQSDVQIMDICVMLKSHCAPTITIKP